jgi:cell division protein FtsW (lipid II flippase)
MKNRKITLLGPEGTNLTLLTIFLLLNFISWMTLFTLSDGLTLDLQNSLFRQMIFTLLAVILFFLITYISMEQINQYTFPFFGLITLLLIFIFTTDPKEGVRRWYDLGIIDFQPSEYIKIAIVLFISKCFVENYNKVYVGIFSLFSIALVFFQPDLGTTTLLIVITLSMFLVSDIKTRSILFIVLLGGVFFFLLLELGLINPYQLNRITNFFDNVDFAQSQSRLAISSGGLTGQFFEMDKINQIFIPVQSTDFIFSAYAYQFGFIGVLLLFALWLFFFYRVGRIIRSTQSDFEKFVLAGFSASLIFQIFINISTVIGVIPVTGIPFPLLSLGGSSIIATAVIFGIINRIFIENNVVI